ncbi:tellurite resistance TerB family protein [Ancylothrix sp. C2]|uniref:tellurite resistance TerB family protein n=1 Tax=Ancylothrix sp. D3o TaxID=2953691 RepID=UPI0021BB6E75|nr:tellurite resistance TerB family protein [Ancylothrix sp. D3o]MCT7950186.1 tellurite resistance TerB family protein [Ancylothrix sp. D3o]
MIKNPKSTGNAEIFESLKRSTTDLVLEPAEALMAISILATTADGNLSEEEKWTLYANHIRIFKSHSGEEFQALLNKVLQLIQQYSSAAVFAAAKVALTSQLRQSAFAMAADLVLSDGVLVAEEKEFLLQLWHALDIPDEIGEKILNVMIIKNCH